MTLRKTLAAIGAAIAVGAVLTGLRLPLPFAIGFALVAGAVALIAQITPGEEPGSDAPHIDVDPIARSTEISRLAWAINPSTGVAGERITRRVREVLRHRLERWGIDPDAPGDAPRRDAVLGVGLWERLTGSATSITDLTRALDAVDRLAPTKEKQ